MAPDDPADTWKFELYIIGDNQRSSLAIENLRGICRAHLHGQCNVDVYDLKKHPEVTSEKKICATPTLIKKFPLPERVLIGDLSFTSKVLEGLDIEQPGTRLDRGKAYHEGLKRQNNHSKLRYTERQR